MAIINTNVPSLNAQRHLSNAGQSMTVALQRLSSGLRINSAKDDAAGLSIAEKMNSQVQGMTVAMRNANDGISAAQTAEAGIKVISGHLQRMRVLAVQSASGQFDSVNRAAIDKEFQQLASEITRAADATQFNGAKLLDGSFSGISFQIGATTSSESKISVSIASVSSSGLGNVSSAAAALNAMSALDKAITDVGNAGADLGAIQNRFQGVLTQLAGAKENTEAARSRIMDTDYADETSNLARAQILQQAATAMLSQANAQPQQVLSLLR